MQALVFHGRGDKRWESKPDPDVREPTDAIVRIDTTTICGTDLHISGTSPLRPTAGPRASARTTRARP